MIASIDARKSTEQTGVKWWARIGPQAFPRLARGLSLKPFQYRISLRIPPIPPGPAVFDQLVIDVGAI